MEPRARQRPAWQSLQILGRARLRRSLVIGLTSRLVGSAELFLLLADYIAATVGPLRRLFARLTRTTANIVTAFLRTRTQHFACFAARARRIEHPRQGSQT